MSKRLTHTPRRISPRLASGDSRVPFGHGLPAGVKDGLRAIAAREGQSMAWVLEVVIIEYFHLRRPRYLTPKTKQTTTKKGPKR